FATGTRSRVEARLADAVLPGARHLRLVPCTRLLHRALRRDLGDRNVPPGAEGWHPPVWVGVHDDHVHARAVSRSRQRVGKLLLITNAGRRGAHGSGVGHVVDLDDRAIEAAGVRVTASQLVGERRHADRALQAVDGLEPVVVDQHDGEREVLGDGSDDLRVHHQVGAVADHHDHVARGLGQLDADAGWDLVAHTGVAVLYVV